MSRNWPVKFTMMTGRQLTQMDVWRVSTLRAANRARLSKQAIGKLANETATNSPAPDEKVRGSKRKSPWPQRLNFGVVGEVVLARSWLINHLATRWGNKAHLTPKSYFAAFPHPTLARWVDTMPRDGAIILGDLVCKLGISASSVSIDCRNRWGKEVSNAVVYNGGTDRYRPRFACNVWCLRGPDKRNLNREISQRNLSSHDSSVLPSPLLPSPLLRPHYYGSYYYPTLLLRLLCLSALLSTWLPPARRLLVTAKREKSSRQKSGVRFNQRPWPATARSSIGWIKSLPTARKSQHTIWVTNAVRDVRICRRSFEPRRKKVTTWPTQIKAMLIWFLLPTPHTEWRAWGSLCRCYRSPSRRRWLSTFDLWHRIFSCKHFDRIVPLLKAMSRWLGWPMSLVKSTRTSQVQRGAQ